MPSYDHKNGVVMTTPEQDNCLDGIIAAPQTTSITHPWTLEAMKEALVSQGYDAKTVTNAFLPLEIAALSESTHAQMQQKGKDLQAMLSGMYSQLVREIRNPQMGVFYDAHAQKYIEVCSPYSPNNLAERLGNLKKTHYSGTSMYIWLEDKDRNVRIQSCTKDYSVTIDFYQRMNPLSNFVDYMNYIIPGSLESLPWLRREGVLKTKVSFQRNNAYFMRDEKPVGLFTSIHTKSGNYTHDQEPYAALLQMLTEIPSIVGRYLKCVFEQRHTLFSEVEFDDKLRG